mmetsp:Transcript_100370/g.321844  ORF Transcript_100370/g.321844 Transcript_100370/m.321844 type:complete len:84 (+) Transcript_100370:86-337(+)
MVAWRLVVAGCRRSFSSEPTVNSKRPSCLRLSPDPLPSKYCSDVVVQPRSCVSRVRPYILGRLHLPPSCTGLRGLQWRLGLRY